MTKVTVIIYESNQVLIEEYLTELRDARYDIEAKIARNLQSFLDFLKEYDPQLIIMDSQIAGLGEVLLGLRQSHPIEAPLILIGDLEREEDFRLSIKNGAYDYVAIQNIYRLTNSAKNAIQYQLLKKDH